MFAPIWHPVVVRTMASTNPGVVIEVAAATQYLASSVRLLYPFVVGPIDHGRFVAPVVFAVAELECTSRSSDHWLRAIVAAMLQ